MVSALKIQNSRMSPCVDPRESRALPDSRDATGAPPVARGNPGRNFTDDFAGGAKDGGFLWKKLARRSREARGLVGGAAILVN